MVYSLYSTLPYFGKLQSNIAFYLTLSQRLSYYIRIILDIMVKWIGSYGETKFRTLC